MLWKYLLLFLFLGVEEGADPEPAPEPTPPADDTLDDLIDIAAGSEPMPSPQEPPDEPPVVKEIRARAERAEREAQETRERLMRLEAERAPLPQGRDPEWDAEEARLRSADITDLERWQIQSNRTLRNNTRTAQQSLLQAGEIADRTEFEKLEITKPKVYKMYKDRVEKALSDLRAKGQNAPRMAMLRLLIGDDFVNGKFKTKQAKTTTTEPDVKRVDRGSGATVRSDVRAGNKARSEHEKRIERLRNVVI